MTGEEFIASIRMDGEKWKEIPGWDRYASSTFGRIASLGAPYLCGNKVCRRKPQLLTPRPTSTVPHYHSVVLSDGNRRRKSFMVHVLVARTFIPNPNNYPEIDHINRNSTDNRVENLRWCTHHMNMMNEETRKHSVLMRRGKKRPSQWKPVVRMKDGTATKVYESIISTGIDGFSITTVGKVCNGSGKSCGGFQWMYLSDYMKTISSSISPELLSETHGMDTKELV